MLVNKSALTQLASEGRYTLQVPQYCIHVNPDGQAVCDVSQHPDAIEIPDDYIMTCKRQGSKMRLCTGRESGFWFLSPKGYEALKNDLREAYEARVQQWNEEGIAHTGSWEQFEAVAKTFFKEVKEATLKHRDNLRKKADQAQAGVDAMAALMGNSST